MNERTVLWPLLSTSSSCFLMCVLSWLQRRHGAGIGLGTGWDWAWASYRLTADLGKSGKWELAEGTEY